MSLNAASGGIAVVPLPALRPRQAGEEQRVRLGAHQRQEVEIADHVAPDLEHVGDTGEVHHAVDETGGGRLGQTHADRGHRCL